MPRTETLFAVRDPSVNEGNPFFVKEDLYNLIYADQPRLTVQVHYDDELQHATLHKEQNDGR